MKWNSEVLLVGLDLEWPVIVPLSSTMGRFVSVEYCVWGPVLWMVLTLKFVGWVKRQVVTFDRVFGCLLREAFLSDESFLLSIISLI